MPYTDATLRLLGQDGVLVHDDRVEKYHHAIAHLDEADFREFYRVMNVVRRFDIEAGNLQRQGHMALWVPSIGQEAAQVGPVLLADPRTTFSPRIGNIRWRTSRVWTWSTLFECCAG